MIIPVSFSILGEEAGDILRLLRSLIVLLPRTSGLSLSTRGRCSGRRFPQGLIRPTLYPKGVGGRLGGAARLEFLRAARDSMPARVGISHGPRHPANAVQPVLNLADTAGQEELPLPDGAYSLPVFPFRVTRKV